MASFEHSLTSNNSMSSENILFPSPKNLLLILTNFSTDYTSEQNSSLTNRAPDIPETIGFDNSTLMHTEPNLLNFLNWTDLWNETGRNWSDNNPDIINSTNENWGDLATHFANVTDKDSEPWLISTIVVSTLLAFVIIATIVGNVFVMAAIFLEKNLQTVGNYLVLSLAVADLMVACLVMPMGAVYEVRQEWIMGPELCEIWTSGDVLCCTASILHLVAIAMDRFWAVTNVDYVRHRSPRRIGLMIGLVWGVGFLVSLAPVFGWKDDDFLYRIQEEKRCLVSQDAGYQVFATCSTFYVPLVVILILYWRIYQVARKRIRHKPGSKSSVQPKRPLVAVVSHRVSSQSAETSSTTLNNGTAEVPPKKKKLTRESVDAKRERKAAKTLAIITGVFVICWLPFFVTALLMAVCRTTCDPNPYLFSFFLWLGYANSMLNPIIYTIFSPDFRSAFKKRVLCGKNKARAGIR